MTLKEFKEFANNISIGDASFLDYLTQLYDSDKRKGKPDFKRGFAYLRLRRTKLHRNILRISKGIRGQKK